ncbi:MAG: hypothetical protein V3V33_12470 [Candidatus Lokiarchaeia archaeon]
MIRIGNKENVLEILKDNKAGLTFADLNIEYTLRYDGKELGHDLYNYINRLVDMGLVETFIPTIRTGKILGFRATEKAWEKEALEILKKMIPKFIESGITVETTTDKEDKILEELINKIAD